jgi:hypothetical protein
MTAVISEYGFGDKKVPSAVDAVSFPIDQCAVQSPCGRQAEGVKNPKLRPPATRAYSPQDGRRSTGVAAVSGVNGR